MRVHGSSERLSARARLAACALVCLLAAGLAPGGRQAVDAQGPGTATVFTGARIITGQATAPLENASLLVENGRIVRVGRARDVKAPKGATVVPLTGKTIMPAIIDTHVHASTDREGLVTDLQRRAYWGVGAMLSLGTDKGDLPFQIRGTVVPDAARFRTAGRGITTPEPGRSDVPYWVTTEEQARQAVREQAALKVDIIKIWVDDRDGKYQKLSPPLYTAVIDEAHKHGLKVTAHIFNLSDAKGLLRAGLDAFAHGIRDVDVDDEVIALFKARPHVVLVPNLPDRGVASDLSWLKDSMPAGDLAKLQAAATDRPQVQQGFALQARNLDRLNKAGVTIALGTDGNTPHGAHQELEDMVAAGMTPAQALVAATRNGAVLLNLKDAGTLEAGKRADFVVLDANPLDAITNTRRISATYLNGVAVSRAALGARWSGSAARP